MSLKSNLVANYSSQIYASLIGILIVPVYLNLMGAESYGLIGFFSLLTSMFALFDMGLTPTMMRESARYNSGASSSSEFAIFVVAFEKIFVCISLTICLILLSLSGYISSEWLESDSLTNEELKNCVSAMALIISLRWLCGLYRGIINGAEKIVWLSYYNIFFATCRFLLVIPIIYAFDNSPSTFFSYQLVVAVFEILVIWWVARRLIPSEKTSQKWSFAPVRKSMRFSLSIAFTSAVWVAITQTDKFVLSNILNLAEYGYFSLAVLAASGVIMLSGPIGTVLMPRFANMEAKKQKSELIKLYKAGSQFAVVMGSTLACFLFAFSDDVIWLWTADSEVVANSALVFGLYCLGNGVLVISAFPYYLQFAKGDMSLHLYGNIVFVIILVPLVVWAATNYGGVGAGYVWLISNLALFYLWLPWVHRRFYPEINKTWFTTDTTFIFGATFLAAMLLAEIPVDSSYRIVLGLKLFVIFVALLCISIICSPVAREYMVNKWMRRLG